jgi:DNA polymerase-1
MFQVFHGIPAMTGTQGQPTNAVFGFTRDILGILDRKPTHLVCAFDSPGAGKRSEIFEAYKANRVEMPEDLRPQIPMIKELLAGFRIPIVECAEWEADDVIATITKAASARDMDVVIVTTDKDARQLLSPTVRMLNCRKNTFFDGAALMEDWGIRPDQVVDFQSLVGDSVDNVPGVPKVGPKTAKTLLETFGTLDHVLANADKAPGKKLQENLIAFADQARMSRELVRLRTDLPLEIDFEAARIQTPDRPKLHAFFRLLNFRRFAAAMSDESSAETATNAEVPPQNQLSAVVADSPPATDEPTVVNDSARVRQQSLFE